MAGESAIIEHGQNLLDVAVHRCGALSAVIDMALLNDLSITDDLLPGVLLLIPDSVDTEIVKYFTDNNIIPATADDNNGAQIDLEGIGYWAIGLDFKVS